MQQADNAAAQALDRDVVVWAKPQLVADWGRDGFGDLDTIDDLSDQMARAAVVHSVFDGMPAEVAFLNQSGVPVMNASLAGRSVDGREMNATQYFSPFRADSPLFGLERDGAQVLLDVGPITDDGPQRVRVFTGQVAGLEAPPENNAGLSAVSTTRIALSQFVQPPPQSWAVGSSDTYEVLTGTWLVSWILHRCGVYPSPPPMPGCVIWQPLHGGYGEFLQNFSVDLQEPIATSGMPGLATSNIRVLGSEAFSGSPWEQRTPRWVRGPYVTGLNAYVAPTSARYASMVTSDQMATTSPEVPTYKQERPKWFRQTENTARIECYIRADSPDFDNLSASVSADLVLEMPMPDGPAAAGVGMENLLWTTVHGVNGIPGGADGNPSLLWWIPASDRTPRLRYWDGSVMYSLTSSIAVPEDGLWHYVGAAWSLSEGKLWLNVDGTVSTLTDGAMLTSNLLPVAPLTDDFFDGAVGYGCWLNALVPLSEVQLSTGPDASPATGGWLRDLQWERKAYVYPSSLRLPLAYYPEPQPAYEALQVLAAMEAGSLTIDESDVFHYRPRGWYATVAAQTEAETITTARHAKTPAVRLDSSRVRNVVQVTYTRDQQFTETPNYRGSWLELEAALEIPPGEWVFRLTNDAPFLFPPGYGRLLTISTVDGGPIDQAGLDSLESGAAVVEDYGTFYTINTEPDGGGSVVEGGILAFIDAIHSFASIDVRFVNSTGRTVYLVNDVITPVGIRVPFLRMTGASAALVSDAELVTYDASVEERGIRTLAVRTALPVSRRMAHQLARGVIGQTARPVPVIDSIGVFGDPRRQVGDLARITDPQQTGVDGQFRVYQVEHASGDDGKYEQTLRLQEAKATGRWGTARWGRFVWAGLESPGIYGEDA